MPPLLRRQALRAAAGLTLILGPAPVLADPAPAFPELLRQAEAAAPRLAADAADVRRAEGLADQAALRPNPVVGLEVENFAGSGAFGGLHDSEATLSVTQALELGGKRGARAAAGRAGVESARARRVQALADFAYDLALAYGRAEASDRRLALSEEALSLAQEDARVARELVAAGKEAELRSVQVQAAVSAARAEVDQRRAEREAAFARLTALAATPAPLTSIVAGLLDREPAAARPADPLSTPAYLAARAEREAAARRVKSEQARATPDLAVSLGVRRLSDMHATAMVASVSAPFPVFDQNRGAVSAARAELDAAEARLNAARIEAETALRIGDSQIAAAGARLAAAREGERAADEAYRLTRVGYEGGKLGLIEVLTARRTLSDARARTLDVEVDRLEAQASLARVTGRPAFGDRP